ncbi:HCP-like protein [Backusella circina FSU 941]|nr:HCP-like protein [Backusella circina FSU 941]
MNNIPNQDDFDYYVSLAVHDMKEFKDILSAAEYGNTEAMYQLGYQYRLKGNKDNYEKSIYWYQQAAAQNYPDAFNDLGYIYLEGLTEVQDYERAMFYFRQASALKSSTAQYNLGHMFMNGLGVPINYKQAIKWYRKAAVKGYAKAQNNIGYMYQIGLGMNPNYNRAKSWYQSAAAQADPRAQYHLGEMHEKGQGSGCNIDEAIQWYTLSAKQGDRDAFAALRRLSLIKNRSLLAEVDNMSSDSNTIINAQGVNLKSDNNATRKSRNRKKKNTTLKKNEQEEKERQHILARIKDLEDRYDKSMYLLDYISNNEEKDYNEDIVERLNKLEEQVKMQHCLHQKMERLNADEKQQRQSMTQRLKMIEGMIEQLSIDSNDSDDKTKRNTPIKIFF